MSKEQEKEKLVHRKMKIEVELQCTYDPGRKRNVMHLKTVDVGCTIKQGEGEKEKEVGSIRGIIGGCLDLHDKATGEIWNLTNEALWNAYLAAKEKSVVYNGMLA